MERHILIRVATSAVMAFVSCLLGQFVAYAFKFGGEPSLAACLFAAGGMALLRVALPGD